MSLYSVLRIPTATVFKTFRDGPRVLTNYQTTRGRRRTCKPPKWFAPKRAPYRLQNEQLTADNRLFLKELVQDKFTPKTQAKTSPLAEAPVERQEWTKGTLRTGTLALKIGVIPQWTNDGKKFFCTMLQILDNHVINYIPPEEYKKREQYKWKKDYGMVTVGAMSSSPHLYNAQYNGLFAKAGLPPKRKLTRFLVTPNAAIEPGTPLYATHYKVGDYVDVQAKTIGHGFQGVVKRWGFKGGPDSHGTTKFHRRPGSSAGGGTKAAIWKGKKMPGHMGMDWVHLKGLKIWRMNTKYNVLYVMGPNLPGPTHCYVRIFDTVLPLRRNEMSEHPPHMPTFYPEDLEEPLPEEIFDKDLFKFTEPTIMYDEKK